ncbi:hypothetical protein IA823_12680 [Listeria welshimeri]|uniref:hypothetical protein n=1 Tax=Listeria welshimeri TaxID=1643 RepID=UPI001625A515|nr:hypothetical protein [Listeria welshimeri]MBC1954549.1 hypothetical protein [Listeria welshimeri]MBF2413491.1 hypothetical protein [Listeria welshimeri]
MHSIEQIIESVAMIGIMLLFLFICMMFFFTVMPKRPEEKHTDFERLVKENYKWMEKDIQKMSKENKQIHADLFAREQTMKKQLSQIHTEVTAIKERLAEERLARFQTTNSTHPPPDIAIILLLAEELVKLREQTKLLEEEQKHKQLLVFAKEPSNEGEKE